VYPYPRYGRRVKESGRRAGDGFRRGDRIVYLVECAAGSAVRAGTPAERRFLVLARRAVARVRVDLCMSDRATPTQACCSTPSSLAYWCIVSTVAFVPLVLLSVFVWHPLGAAALPFAIGIGCVANWLKNRTYHCGITGPIFLLAGIALLLIATLVVKASSNVVWALAVAGTVVAFFLESRYAKRVEG
jgi:hypothetical protein